MVPLASNRVVTAPAVAGATTDAPAAISKPAHKAHQICNEVDTGPPNRPSAAHPTGCLGGCRLARRAGPARTSRAGPARGKERPLRLRRRLAADPVQDPKEPGLEPIHSHPVLVCRGRDLFLGKALELLGRAPNVDDNKSVAVAGNGVGMCRM